MYYICNPKQIRIYINTSRKTAQQIQKELGCDVLVNGGLYDMRTFKPYCWLKVDGETLHGEAWSDWGFGFDSADLRMDSSVNIDKYRNFISCVSILKGGTALRLSYPAELGGKRARTAIGIDSAGRVVAYCVPESTPLTPEELQIVMRQLGCEDALMLDGGGSSQCIMPNGKVTSSRIVQNYIAIWTKTPDMSPISSCPYIEPTKNVRWGSIGEGARWVQWQLNRHGALLDVDGLFFGQSVEALRKFQHNRGLAWDGVCGELTREALRK